MGASPTDDSAMRDAARDRQNKEVAERARLYNDALTDRSIDETTRAEIADLYQSGGNSVKLSELIAAAGEGKGIYGVRKLNDNAQTASRGQPGRSQLVASGGQVAGVAAPVVSAASVGSLIRTGGRAS